MVLYKKIGRRLRTFMRFHSIHMMRDCFNVRRHLTKAYALIALSAYYTCRSQLVEICTAFCHQKFVWKLSDSDLCFLKHLEDTTCPYIKHVHFMLFLCIDLQYDVLYNNFTRYKILALVSRRWSAESVPVQHSPGGTISVPSVSVKLRRCLEQRLVTF